MEETAPKTSVWSDTHLGLRYILQYRPLLLLLLSFAAFNAASGAIDVLLPLLAMFSLAADSELRGLSVEATIAVLSTAAGIGGIVGGAFMTAWGGLKRQRVFGVLLPRAFVIKEFEDKHV